MSVSLRILFWSLVSQLGWIHVIASTFIFLFILYLIASVGVTPHIFPTFNIAQKQEEVELSVLQCW